MEELFASITDLLGLSSPIVGIIFLTGLLGATTMMVWRVTGGFLFGSIAGCGTIIVAAYMGIIPIWVSMLAGLLPLFQIVSRLVGVVIDGPGPVKEAAKMAPNQLIQDTNKQPIQKTKEEVLRQDGIIKEKELREGFTKLNFNEGLKVLKDLQNEYNNLGLVLVSKGIDDALVNSKRISVLTKSLYQQGLSLLIKALNVYQQSGVTNVDSLIAENRELGTELERYDIGSTMHSLVSERLSRNTNSIRIIKSSRDRLDELFMETELCTDSIREIRLGLPELMSGRPRDELDKAMLELRTRMEFAQKVQAEYASQGI